MARYIKGRFVCVWCNKRNPLRERIVPNYYRADYGHRRGPLTCYACHIDGMDKVSSNIKPKLDALSLRCFFEEEPSSAPIAAAMEFFGVSEKRIQQVINEIVESL